MRIRVGTAAVMLLALSACGGATDIVIDASDAPVAPSEAAPVFSDGSTTQSPVEPPTAAGPTSEGPTIPATTAVSPVTFLPPEAEAVASRLGDITYDHLEGCPDAPRAAVTDKANQRYWLCINGDAVTDEIPMTTASGNYGLPPIGIYPVFARDDAAFGLGGEALERFVAFYTTPTGNRIAFHEVVNQSPETVGDLDQRGASAGCFRVREEDSVQVWEFLQIGDPVAVISN